MATYEEQTLAGFEAESLCSARVFPASRQVLPGSAEAKKMTVGSGRQCSMLLDQSSPLGAFSKILLESLHWSNSEEFSYVWNRLDTKFGLSAFQLTPLGQSTDDSGCSLLGTAMASPGGLNAHTQGVRQTLARLWRTPNERDWKGTMGGAERLDSGHQMNLGDQAKTPKLWPTPRANENDQGPANREKIMEAGTSWTGQGRGMTLTTAAKLWPTPRGADGERNYSVSPASARKGGNLTEELSRMLWLTPTDKGNYNKAGLSEKSGNGLATAAKLFPTPTVPNGGRRNPEGTSLTGKKPDGGKAQMDLREFAIRMWPTLKVQCGKNNASPSQHNRNSDPLDVVAAKMSGCVSGSLNPRFVEELMGFPIDHTALRRSGTQSSRSRRTRSSRRSLLLKESNMANQNGSNLDDELNAGLEESVKQALQSPRTQFPTVPSGIGIPPKPEPTAPKQKSLATLGISKGGVVRNSSTIVRSQLNNPIANPKSVATAKSSILDRPDSNLTPEFGVSPLMTGMDDDLGERAKRKAESVLPAAPPIDPEPAAPKMATMRSTLQELLAIARAGDGALRISTRQFSLLLELKEPF
jgi:hypothetical protein